MTHDTDESGHPFKIDICLEDDKGNTRKAFLRRDLEGSFSEDDQVNTRKTTYEDGLGALLVDPHFLLLHVPDDGGKMKIIQPANNLYHRNQMIKRINETKQDTPSCYYALSHLWGLTENNRYLWHEIGDYVDDEEGNPVDPVSMRPEKRDALLKLLKEYPDSYWWVDVLCARTDTPLDIMGDIYSCCFECIAMIDCEPNLIPKIHAMSKEKIEFDELYCIKRKTEQRWPTYKELCETKAPQQIKRLCTFFDSKWWQRVWTWQEMALPLGDIRFMAETDTHRLHTNTITLDDLLKYNTMVTSIQVCEGYNMLDEVDVSALKAVCGAVSSNLSNAAFAKYSNSRRLAGGVDHIYHTIESLRQSNRRCYDPVDYVYGVLGMMRIKIPRMDDSNKVWRHFLTKLDDLLPTRYGSFINIAGHIDLQKFETIGEIYTILDKTLQRIE